MYASLRNEAKDMTSSQNTTSSTRTVTVSAINTMMEQIREKFNVSVAATNFSDTISIRVEGAFDWFDVLEVMQKVSSEFMYSMTKGNATTYNIDKEFVEN